MKMQQLTCEQCGAVFSRPSTRGRPPKACPECRENPTVAHKAQARKQSFQKSLPYTDPPESDSEGSQHVVQGSETLHLIKPGKPEAILYARLTVKERNYIAEKLKETEFGQQILMKWGV